MNKADSSNHARACGPDFLYLANVLSALYPRVNQGKRLLDAMLLAVPRSSDVIK